MKEKSKINSFLYYLVLCTWGAFCIDDLNYYVSDGYFYVLYEVVSV